MKFALVSLAAAAAVAVATPALANEARVEARTGLVWNSNDNNAIAGVAAGYDYDIGSNVFVGVEGSADKVLTDHTRFSWGIGGRIGANVTPATKLYAVSTWQSKFCKYCESSVALGAGVQQNLGTNLYGKVEYKHYMIGEGQPDFDAGLIGVGVHF